MALRADWRRPTVRLDRPRVLLGVTIVAAAMPFRPNLRLPLYGSMSVLDMVLAVAALTFLLDLPHRRLSIGPVPLFALLTVPVVASVLALGPSQDRASTLRVATFSVESLLAYLFVLRELEGLPAERVIAWIERFVVLLIIPAVLLLFGVPGFQPEQPDLSKRSGDYLSYFTRLSHPILGRSNNLATVLVIFVPVLLWWGHVHGRRSATRVGVLVMAALLATESRGVLIASVTASILYLLSRQRRHGPSRPVIGKALLATATLGCAGAAFYMFNAPTHEFLAGRLSTANFSLRADLYRAAFDHLRERPLLGFGPGVVPDRDPALTVDVHNTYIQQLLSFGVLVGFVVALSLVALPVVLWHRQRSVAVAGAVGLGVAIDVISFAFESSYEGTVLRVIFYLSIGFLVGVVEASRADQRALLQNPAESVGPS